MKKVYKMYSFEGFLINNHEIYKKFSLLFKLSSDIVDENSPQNTVIGNFSTVDSDLGQSYTYKLLSDAGGRFEISGNALMVRNVKTIYKYMQGGPEKILLERIDYFVVNSNFCKPTK